MFSVMWRYVVWYIFTIISEETTASIFRVDFSKLSVSICPITRSHIQGESNFHSHHSRNQIWRVLILLTLYNTLVTVYTFYFNIRKTEFCTQIPVMCFIWFSEKTVIISLSNINRLVFIMETLHVYRKVRTKFLNIYKRFVLRTSINFACHMAISSPVIRVQLLR
jgi:hypothetical protein